MSIATDEAEEAYPIQWKKGKKPDYIEEDSDIIREHLRTIPHVKNTDFQAAYVAGRTAEPTEAEIDAALPELIEAYRHESQLVTDRDYVARILLAARKAVTR